MPMKWTVTFEKLNGRFLEAYAVPLFFLTRISRNPKKRIHDSRVSVTAQGGEWARTLNIEHDLACAFWVLVP